MGNESEEALAEPPEMIAPDEHRQGASPDDDEAPSAEVLAESAAAERDAAERRGSSGKAGKAEQAERAEPEEPTADAAQGAIGAAEAGSDAAEDESAAMAETRDADAASGADADAGADAATSAEAQAAEPEEGPGALLSDDELRRVITALLFASPDALSEARLAQLAEGAPKARVKAALTQLESELADSPLPLELRKLAGGWRLMTAAEMSDVVARLFQARKSERLSAAGLETLAVVAYRQPVTKADIEAIRGVQCGPMLRTLVDRGLVKVTGRADLPGGPLEYGTTRDFLDRFGLGGLEELPRDGELLG